MLMKYLWTEKDSDQMFGTFDSIEAAFADAALALEDRAGEVRVQVFDSRPATKRDKADFEYSEDIDVDEPGWWEKCVVPENVVRIFTFLDPKRTR